MSVGEAKIEQTVKSSKLKMILWHSKPISMIFSSGDLVEFEIMIFEIGFSYVQFCKKLIGILYVWELLRKFWTFNYFQLENQRHLAFTAEM